MAKAQDLQTRFNTDIVKNLMKKLNKKNIMSLPKVKQISINVGMGNYIKAHGKDYSAIVNSIEAISGQKVVITKAKKAVSNFKVRENDPIGVVVTLRGKRMYDFLDKLVNVVFPRVRDFRGISPKSFDGKGNYSIGFKEHVVFPEIHPDEVSRIHGIQINILTSAENNEEAFELLSALGFPFKKQ